MSFNNENNNKNFIIAMLLFLVITLGIDHFFGKNQQNNTQNLEVKTEVKKIDSSLNLDQALSSYSRVNISNDKIKGSIRLKGGIIDDILLLNYKESTEPNSNNVRLLTPKDSKNEYYYFIEYKDNTNNEYVAIDTEWQEEKSSKSEVILNTKTNNGIVINRTIKLDKNYLIKITDKITNTSDKPINISKSSNLIRKNPKLYNYSVVHEGLVGNTEGNVKEIKYNKINKETVLQGCKWFGYSDPYWLCSIINKSEKHTISYREIDDNTYRITSEDYKELILKKGDNIELNYGLFTGPKDINLLNEYKEIDKFDMAIDFGWFFILTKPLIKLMGLMEKYLHNMGIVILLLTIMFRLLTYPLMKKSFVSMAKMRKIQPKIEQLKKLYSDDKFRMNQELVAIYKKEQISPLSGCLPMILQMPIFFCLYKVFFISISMRHAPLFGWVKDLSAQDSCYFINLFGLIDWNPPSFLQIGLWPLIMGVTMIIQQKFSTVTKSSSQQKTPEQKMQEKMMFFMPIVFTYICSSFPVSVVVYWTISNIIGIFQQKYVNKTVASQV